MMSRRVGLISIVLLGAVCGLSRAQEELPKLNSEGFTSSLVCGECHQAIHAVWRQSLHAQSWSNGVFQAGYRRAIESHGTLRARMCLSCHAPTTRHTKDYGVIDPITAEGVTCDFCHSIKAVDLADRSDPIRLTVGAAKYGPLLNAQSPVHEIVDSPLHTRSEFCAGCHQYKNKNGVTVLGTFSEWKASPYAKLGKQCQDCHMPLVPGRVVALGVKGRARPGVNLHNISGSHDMERVREAITLELTGASWFEDRVDVFLEVGNQGSGHCFPTGLPMHRATLNVVLRERGLIINRREIPFEVVLLDKSGRRIQREHEAFLTAAKIGSDSRLKPKEVRKIEVSFDKVRASKLTVSASLYYEYSTETIVVEEGKERIDKVEMRFLIASAERAVWKMGH